ncbi:hypothetical protein [Paraburkholderia kururiensis]|uniref:hypothetical protein n=1 Tax=Paraburkholderia kururiensis TaxID=984307 RepID=UPI0005AA30D2|nr:hypothetical protein [Paraburkholderia kururiensis]
MKFSSMRNCISYLISLAVTAFFASDAFAQGVLAPHTNAAPQNSVALAAANIGARQCLSQLTTLSSLGIQNTTGNDVLFDWDRKRGGASSVFSLLGLELPGGGAAMSVTAVPEADGSCSVSAERISVAPVTCKTVAQRELGGYHATPLLAHMTVYSDAKAPSSTVSLIESPPGCLVIRRYVKFSSVASGGGIQ